MKAVAYDRFGDPGVLAVREVPEPRLASGYARVRVCATALNPKDVLVRKGKLRWLVGGSLPRIPGYDVSGVLMDDVPGFEPAAEVFGMIQDHRGGACAEVVSIKHDQFAPKPASLTMVEAASLPLAGLTALQALRDELRLRPGDTVMINGASGGVGTLAVQLAKALGASVVAVCSGRNAELVGQLGADEVIDYTRSSPRERRGLDAIFDCYGSLPWPLARRCLNSGGRYCTAIPHPAAIGRGVLGRLGLHRAALVVVKSRREDLVELSRLVASGGLRPVVEEVFPLERTEDAHRRIESRRTRGKLVLTVADSAA